MPLRIARPLSMALAGTVLVLVAPPDVGVGVVRADGFLRELSGPRAAARLSSPDVAERRQAARSLAKVGNPTRAVAALTEALETERYPEVRRAIVRSLARRGHPRAVRALSLLLRARETGSTDAFAVAYALAAIGTVDAVKVLVDALERPELAAPARAALGRVGPFAIPFIVRVLRVPSATEPAIGALGDIGGLAATPFIVPFLGDPRPMVRRATAIALRRIADPRSAAALSARLVEPEAAVLVSVIDAIAALGTPGDAKEVAKLLGHESGLVRRAALRAYYRLDPFSASRRFGRELESGGPLSTDIVDLVIEEPKRAALPILFGLLTEGIRAGEVASSLARVERGLGVPVMLVKAEGETEIAHASRRELAVAARRYAADLPGEILEQVFAVLRSSAEYDGRARSLLLRAIARDETVGRELVKSLKDEEPSLRATAALGIQFLGYEEAGLALLAALHDETDPEVIRRLCTAAMEIDVSGDVVRLSHLFDRPEVAAEAMALAALSSGDRASDRLRERLRLALRASDPRTRSGSAFALAAIPDKESYRAVATLLEDPVSDVRRAAARALETLRVHEALPLIRGRRRVEEDEQVRAALLDAIESVHRRPLRSPWADGREVLRVKVRSASSALPSIASVDVVLPDGSWWRIRSLPTGELFYPDQPHGIADIQLRLGPS